MYLIADSGSTKTHWALSEGNSMYHLYTSGINPFYHSEEEIVLTLQTSLIPQFESRTAEKVFFYGAGCSQSDKIDIVKRALQTIFPHALIEVEHDLLAAARALCGRQPGIACILGTGSNSCLYDGENIQDNIPSLGFILGDEGSGGDLGRRLLKAYFYREMPDSISLALEQKYDMSRENVLNEVYGKNPNRAVAAYTDFISDQNSNPFIAELLKASFTEFLTRHVMKYKDYEDLMIHFTGSVAFLNKHILKATCEQLGLLPGFIQRSPMDGLIQYHSLHGKDN